MAEGLRRPSDGCGRVGLKVQALEEGTFTICTFWMADNLVALGEMDRARALFRKLLECTNDLGLYSEQMDGDTGEMLGDFPQAFSHMALINTTVQLGATTT